jgi:superfamily I DNA and/or RNA helicase
LKAKDRRSRGEIRRELRALGKEEHQRQQQAVADVIKDSTVILTTLTGALSRQLRDTTFDVVIIDEAAQALEVACWIALLKAWISMLTNLSS